MITRISSLCGLILFYFGFHCHLLKTFSTISFTPSCFRSMLLSKHVLSSTHKALFQNLRLFSLLSNSHHVLSTHSRDTQLREALLQMALRGHDMNFQDYSTVLNECVSKRAFREGQRVHAHMIKTNYLPCVFLWTRLIVFYVKCDSLTNARNLFDEMPQRNVVSWTAMISAYSQRGYASQALSLFVQMLRSGILGVHVLCTSTYMRGVVTFW